jgi:hypothetical protein
MLAVGWLLVSRELGEPVSGAEPLVPARRSGMTWAGDRTCPCVTNMCATCGIVRKAVKFKRRVNELEQKFADPTSQVEDRTEELRGRPRREPGDDDPPRHRASHHQWPSHLRSPFAESGDRLADLPKTQPGTRVNTETMGTYRHGH